MVYAILMSTKLYFEDFEAGQSYDLGQKCVSKEEIIEFAAEFDPQPFHMDEKAGAASMLGGLAASGWHTASMGMRLLAENLLNNSSCQGSPGITELGWKGPVFPGDTLSASANVVTTRALKSKPELGLVSFKIEIQNQSGKTVMVQENPILFKKREASA